MHVLATCGLIGGDSNLNNWQNARGIALRHVLQSHSAVVTIHHVGGERGGVLTASLTHPHTVTHDAESHGGDNPAKPIHLHMQHISV